MGEPANKTKKTLIVISVILYIGHLGLQYLATKGGPDSQLFPLSPQNVSDHFMLEITPVGKTFAIWGVIFALQALWLLYSFINIFRSSEDANILSTKLYVAFIVNVFFITLWIFSWPRLQIGACLAATFCAQVAIWCALGFSFVDLKAYLDEHEDDPFASDFDAWCIRILVQNGIQFYATWTLVATLINAAIVMSYEVGLATQSTSLIALVTLGLLVISWFIVENSVLIKYTQCTIATYVVLIIALSGILANIYGYDPMISRLTIGLLVVSVLGFFMRLAVVLSEFKNKSLKRYSKV